MEQLILRQAAIDALIKMLSDCFYADEEVLDAVKATLDELPPAQPEPQERKTGRWIRDEFGSRCGACGLYAYRDKFDRPWESPYCPNCGCTMEVNHEQND